MNWKRFFICLIVIGIILIMVGVLWRHSDANPAEEYCETVGGEYTEEPYEGALNASMEEMCTVNHVKCNAWALLRGEC